MSTLFVITVPAENMAPDEREDWVQYAVLLADCILPGHTLGRYAELAAANAACEYYADHYGLRAHTFDTARHRRAALTLVAGGKTS